MMTKHMVQRSLTFIALTSILACTGDPTGDFKSGPDHLVATPSAVYVGNGTIQTVVVSSVDEAGNQVEDDFSLGTVGAGITVTRDNTFDLVRNDAGELVPNPHPTRVRFNVTTTTFQATQFTVNAGNRSVTIPVRTEPAALNGPVSNFTPNNGDTVTITAPSGVAFNPASSVVTFSGVATFLVSRSATEIKFVPPPAASGAATVSNVSVDYAPELTFTVPTEGQFAVGAFPNLIASQTGPVAWGTLITINIPAPFKWGRGAGTSSVVSTGGTLSAVTVAADSSSVFFQIGPNATDTLRITGLRINGTTLGGYQLKAQAATTTPPLTVGGSWNATTNTVGDTLVFTAAAGLKLRRPQAAVNFFIGVTAVPGIVVSIAADSNSMRVLPPPGANSTAASISGMVLSVLPTVPLTLNASNIVNVSATATRYAGTLDPTTAPALTLPAVGDSIQFYDVWTTGVIDKFYAFTIAGASNWTFTTDWEGTADVDALRCPSTSPGCTAGIGSLGATAAHPETATLALGTTAGNTGLQKLWINLYDGNAPKWIKIKIKRNS